MFVLCAAMVWSVVGQVDAETLLKEHEAHLRKIESLQCALEIRHSYDGGKTWKSTWRTNLTRSGGRERVHHFQSWLPMGNGQYRDMARHIDAYFGPEGVLSMEGFDPEHPPVEPWTVAEEMRTKNRLAGMIRPVEQVGPFGFKGGLAGDGYLMFLPDALNSLADLIKATGQVTPTERRNAQGDMLWDLALKDPKWPVSYVVSLSPKHGYAIAEVVRTVHKVDEPPKKKTTTVVEFQEPAPGIFVPKVLRQGDYSGSPLSVLETVVRDVKVNTPIAEKDLAFRFPRGIGVAEVAESDDKRNGAEVQRYLLWGDGKPDRAMTVDEYREWRREQMTVKVPN